jgi:hypothetical protein
MFYETGNRILNQLERPLGKLALPNILRWIASFQVMTWGLSLFSEDFLIWIDFDRSRILSGEVWRLITWPVYPAASNPLFVLFAAFFMFFINDSLERAWSSFRLNVYVFACIILCSLCGLLLPVAQTGSLMNMIFYSCSFLAFATLFPDQTIQLFGIIPIKAKWLGWANAAILFSVIVTSHPIFSILIFGGMLPYLITFVPGFFINYKARSEATVRRHRFQRDTSPGKEAFHECERCGATELTHPEREFRVSNDDRELCDNCRKEP